MPKIIESAEELVASLPDRFGELTREQVVRIVEMEQHIVATQRSLIELMYEHNMDKALSDETKAEFYAHETQAQDAERGEVVIASWQKRIGWPADSRILSGSPVTTIPHDAA